MNSTYLQLAVPAFVALIFIEASYSHLKGLRLYNLRNSLSCLGCGMFTTTVEVFTKAALVALYAGVHERFSWQQLADERWLTWLTAIVLFDFLWYWAHRLSHEVNFLWGGHSPHHQSEEFNLSAGLRQGALQDLMYWPLYLPMALIGYSPEIFVASLLINKFYGFWLHTRAIGKIPLIEGILSTPSAHRVHHGMNDRYLDKNHGGILILFDRMFGTYQEEDENVIYGVRNRHTSFSPVSAHFDWLKVIWRDARETRMPTDKLKIWFLPPGWRPADVAARHPRAKFEQDAYVKFDADPAEYPILMPLTLFLVLSGASQFLILRPELTNWGMKGALAASIIAGLVWLGQLLDAGYAKHA
jgi:alkylglycerol monooxygenase